jgi:transposase
LLVPYWTVLPPLAWPRASGAFFRSANSFEALEPVRQGCIGASEIDSAEEKIRIVLEGLRGEVSIAELCRKEGINQNLYYRWSKEFLEAGKKRLAGDMAR